MIKLVVLDVDGCLSDGKIIYDANGVELKNFNVKDGFAIVHSMPLGLEFAIITGRDSIIVQNRAKELGIRYLYQGVKDKLSKLDELCELMGITKQEVACVGDDLNDYKILKSVGLSFAPKDAIGEIKEVVDIVLSLGGGEGAVREMIEIVLEKNSMLEKFRAKWL